MRPFSFWDRALEDDGDPVRFSPENLVRIARTYLGTPWHHAGRVKGLDGGIDCCGLLIGVMANLGVAVLDDLRYSRGDELTRLTTTLGLYANTVDDARTGDVMVFRGKGVLNHCGIWTGENTMIHCWNQFGCVEETYSQKWERRLHSIYRYRGTL